MIREMQGLVRKILGMELSGGGGYSFYSGSSRSGSALTDPVKALDANQSWVWACVDAVSEGTANVAVELYRQRAGMQTRDEWEEIHDHPALDLLESPNYHMDGHELTYITQAWLEIWGNALWQKVRLGRGAAPEEIWPIPWHYLDAMPGGGARTTHWKWKPQFGSRPVIPAEDVIHWRKPNPGDLRVGRATVASVAQAVDLRYFIVREQLSEMKNGTRNGTTIEADRGATQKQIDDFYAAFRENHSGPERSHFPLVVRGGWKVGTSDKTSREFDYGKGKEEAREEILAAFRTPLAMLGQSKEYSRANLEGALFAFQKFALEPRVQARCRKLQKEFFGDPAFLESVTSRLICEHEEFILRDEANARAWIQLYLGAGTGVPMINPAEARKLANLPPDDTCPELKQYWIGGTMRPIDEPPPSPAPFGQFGSTSPAPDVPDEEEEEPELIEEEEEKSARPFTARDLIWKRFAVAHSRSERKLLKAYKKVLAEQKVEVLSRIKRIFPRHSSSVAGWGRDKAKAFLMEQKGLADSIFPPLEAESARMEKATRLARKEIVVEAADGAFREMGFHNRKDITDTIPELDDDTVDQFIRNMGLNNITLLNKTKREKLRAEFVDVLADGGTLDDMAKAAGELYDDDASAWRAARTETTGAWNWGQLEAGKEAEALGLTITKSWLSAQDERTRSGHAKASDDYAAGIPLDQPFMVAAEEGDSPEPLMEPGDPDGSAENIIQCRCTVVLNAKEE